MSTIAPFKKRLKNALDSPTLEEALERALSQFRERRNAAFEPGEFPILRDDLKRRKDDALDRLPELVAQFKTEAEKVGAVVHFAEDAEDACRIVNRLAQERGVKLAVKTKSMATEEIQLNPYLEEQGIRVVETDLGEWILQLAKDHPSHLIAPAIHWRREEVAELFSKETGETQPPDIEKLVKVARRELRQAFIDADMGISGGNMGIANSGTIVLVTNEGNADLVTTLPPIHVAIMGVEKIVPTLDDATAILKLLPRSATGQRLSSYTGFITGPSRTGDIELSMTMGVHGPKEVHIILLDNGRWAMRDDPDFRDALRCIRCAACANYCPSYQAVGGQVFGHIYNGPIGLILSAQHHGLESAAGPQSLCTGCNACETVCPVGIPLPRLIMGVRQRSVAEKGLPTQKRMALNTLAQRKDYDGWGRIAKMLQSPFTRTDTKTGHRFLRIPFVTEKRNLPALAPQSLHLAMAQRQPAAPNQRLTGNAASGKRVALFTGCITNLIYPEMGEAVATVAESLGAQVSFPQEQWCCGLALLNAGDREAAKPLAKQTIETLEACEDDYIMSGSASCVVAIQQDYLDLFKDEPEWSARAQALAKRITDFTHFVDGALAPITDRLTPATSDDQQTPGAEVAEFINAPAKSGMERVTIHDSCQSFNCLGLSAETRRILGALTETEVTEMVDASVCCGFGGSFSTDHPKVADRIFQRKLRNVQATGAQTVVADNPGCIMHLRGGINAQGGERKGEPLQVLHLAELLAQRLRAET